MKTMQKSFYFAAMTLLVMSLLLEEVDARRKILRGRKTITRSYYRGPGIPAWAIIVMVAGGQLVVGGVLYLIMRKVVLGNSTGNASYNTVQA